MGYLKKSVLGGWGAAHDARLLLGTAIHGWGNFEAIRRQRALWENAPPLVAAPPLSCHLLRRARR